jgi:hypothetical protein
MGRQVVEQITCDRCTRVEHRPVKDAPKDGEKKPDFVGLFLGERIQFEDLCSPCQEIVMGHWAQINKELSKSSPRRPKKAKG